jgi:DNA-binding transcriptional LysR family regulator
MGTVGGNLCQRPRCWYYRMETVICKKKGGTTCYALEGENKYNAIFDDMVSVGAGIGWLNTWQAERESGRTDVAIRPLVPVGMHDVFRIAWRAGDTSPATATCVRVLLEACGA